MMLPQIKLPWAKTSEMSANGRLHWAARNRKVTAQKRAADALAREAGWRKGMVPTGADARVTMIYCPPSVGGIPDEDNLIAAQKGALDALAAVLGVNDKQFRIQAPVRGERCKGGAVIIQVEVA